MGSDWISRSGRCLWRWAPRTRSSAGLDSDHKGLSDVLRAAPPRCCVGQFCGPRSSATARSTCCAKRGAEDGQCRQADHLQGRRRYCVVKAVSAWICARPLTLSPKRIVVHDAKADLPAFALSRLSDQEPQTVMGIFARSTGPPTTPPPAARSTRLARRRTSTGRRCRRCCAAGTQTIDEP